MVKPGETLTDDYDARIVVDIKDDAFIVSHTRNIELDQVYMIFVAAIEYMENVEFEMNKPRTLN